MLVDVADGDGRSEFDPAGVRGQFAGDQSEEGGFADAVGADDADDGVSGQFEGAVVEEEISAEALGDLVKHHHLIPERGAGRDLDQDIALGVRSPSGPTTVHRR